MDRRTRHSTRLQALDSDPDSPEEDPTLSGGLPEFSAEGLEQLRQVATEIIEGATASRFQPSDLEAEEDDEDQDEGGYAFEKLIGIESSDDSLSRAGGCGGTPTGIVRERLSWQPVQTFDHSIMSQEEISKEISSMLVRDLKITGFEGAPKGSSGANRNGNDIGLWKLKNVVYCFAYSSYCDSISNFVTYFYGRNISPRMTDLFLRC